jgi:hypothetical protein
LARFDSSGKRIDSPSLRHRRPVSGRASASTAPHSALRAPLGLRSSRRSSGNPERRTKKLANDRA